MDCNSTILCSFGFQLKLTKFCLSSVKRSTLTPGWVGIHGMYRSISSLADFICHGSFHFSFIKFEESGRNKFKLLISVNHHFTPPLITSYLSRIHYELQLHPSSTKSGFFWTFRKKLKAEKTQGNFLQNSSLFSKNSRFCQLNLTIFAIQKILLEWSNFPPQLLGCKF